MSLRRDDSAASMSTSVTKLLGAALLSTFVGCTSCAAPRQAAVGTPTTTEVHSNPRTVSSMDNPLLVPSPYPYGLPVFDRIENAHFEPAFEQAMSVQLKQVATIAENPDPPSFENTVVALERSGLTMARVSAVFSNLVQSNTNSELDALESKLAPHLAAHEDALLLDRRLFARIDVLFANRASLGLSPEEHQLLTRYHERFVRAGARLSEHEQQRLRAINEALASLTADFRHAVLEGVNASAVVVDDATELAGLSEQQRAVVARAANERGLSGKYLIALVNTTVQPVLADLENRELRRRIFLASVNRGSEKSPSPEHVTTKLIAQIVALRAERAALLGYQNHAAYVLEDETAETPAAVNAMLARLVPRAVENARAEAKAIQAVIDAEARAAGVPPFELKPWDWDRYAARVKAARFDFDLAEVTPYFELHRVLRDGVLYAAARLYGLRFEERPELPMYHPDVRAFEVFDRDGTPLGLCLFDWFSRDNKRGGAWMSDFVQQSSLLGQKPVVATNLNVAKPPPGHPALMSFDEVTTAFHELGHALHGLLSNVRYPTLSGTSVPTDFVEYPSQFNEMWATDPDVLAHYAVHFQTGAPMPKDLMSKVIRARQFNQGYETTEYLAAALLDQAYHQLTVGQTPAADEIEGFEAKALERAHVDASIVPPRYRSTYFSHIFSDPIGYSAGYYSYIWSEVLARDTERWFDTHGGLLRANGDALREQVLSRGHTREPLAMFEAFTGGPPDVTPLLKARGLEQPSP